MESQENEDYILSDADETIIAAAKALLKKVERSNLADLDQREVVQRMLGVLDRLPGVSEEMWAEVGLRKPEQRFGEHRILHYWQIRVDGHEINIVAGGSFWRPSTGGDSFTSLSWTAWPGCETDRGDYLGSLGIVDDAMPFADEVEGIDLSQPGYKLDVSLDGDCIGAEGDEDDTEKGDAEPEFEPDKGASARAEQALAQHADMERATRMGQTHSSPPQACDLCRRSLQDCKYFVDGQIKGDRMWANMCGVCFSRRGEGVGWGNGQLYVRQAEDSWLMVAGFQPEEA